MIYQLRRKFIRIAMISVALVIVAVAVSVNILNFCSVDADLRVTLELIAENRGTIPQFSPEGVPKLDHIPGVDKDKLRPNDRFSPETSYVTRYFILRYDDSGVLDMSDMKHIAAVTEEDTAHYLAIAVEKGEGSGYVEGRYKYLVTSDGDGKNVAIFLDCQQDLHAVSKFALLSMGVCAVCIVLTYLLVILLSRRAIDPIVRNAEKQKQFITDAGHELKTPITVISTSLKVLEMEVGRQKWIDKIQAQVEKLTELVGDLVALSRMDEEHPPLQFSRFDASAAVTEAAESFREVAENGGHELRLDVAPGLSLCGDEYSLRQLVSILLDNGVKYADSGSPISLSLKPAKSGVLLETSNACADLDTSDLDKLFDRFYRADRARTKQGSGGFGIGLSIARSIAEAHRGSIRADSPSAGVIRFSALLKNR